MARTAALSFFQNPAHDRESNPHLTFTLSALNMINTNLFDILV